MKWEPTPSLSCSAPTETSKDGQFFEFETFEIKRVLERAGELVACAGNEFAQALTVLLTISHMPGRQG